MKKLKKITILTIILTLFLVVNIVRAVDTTAIEQYMEENNLKTNTIKTSDVITMYQELSKEYTNQEIAEMIDEYSETLEKNGLSSEAISTGKTLLNSTDAETINEVLEDVDIESIKEKLDNGETLDNVVKDVQANMSTKQKVSTAGKILLSNGLIKSGSTIWIICTIYLILIRGIIYKKAGEPFWATFIPLYRDVILFRICGYSAWWLCLLLLPIVGWFMYGILKIVMKFELSKAFGKGIGFGFGVWLLNPIFESIIAFSGKCKFIEIED